MHKTFFKSDILPPKKVKKIWKPKPRKATGERELFLEVWNTRKHRCEICGCPILEPKAWCFAHRFSKGTHKNERLDPNNITLVCSLSCHNRVDSLRRHSASPSVKTGIRKESDKKVCNVQNKHIMTLPSGAFPTHQFFYE